MLGLPTPLQTLRRNWQIFLIAGVVLLCVGTFGIFFFVQGSGLMQQQLKDKLRTTAAIAAMQFDPMMIDKLAKGTADVHSADYRDVVTRLENVREEVPTIHFAYIMKKTADPMHLIFVADADSLATPTELDTNHNGLVDENEKASYPGDMYDVSEAPALQKDAFEGPSVDENFTIDQWGALISGYAPIRAKDGHVIAVLGIDMDASEYTTLSRSIFSPVAFLLFALVSLLISSLVAVYLWRRRLETFRHIDQERAGLMLLTMHQIGSPLTILKWSLEQLEDQVGKGGLEKAVEEHAHNIREASGMLDTILRELHNANDVDTGSITYVREWLSLSEVILAVVKELTPALKQRSQSVKLDIDFSLHFSMDRTMISAVIRELIQNAMTFSQPNSEISVTAKHGGKCVLVDVVDHGCGIAKEDLPRVFEKYTRGAKAHLYQPNGNGLGLYITKGIIDRAGGDIWIKSKEGKGTTVTFTLPC